MRYGGDAIHALAKLVVGLKTDCILEYMCYFCRHINSESQLRWIGTDKGAIHLLTGGVVNAVLHEMNINGRAAAIECYQDLTSPKTPDPVVWWSKFMSDVDAYQGSLESKGQFMKTFLNLRPDTGGMSGYNFNKIQCVLDTLYGDCVWIVANA